MDGSGARYSGVMYRSPLDPLATVAADVMAAEVNRDLKGHPTMASNEGGDEEGLGVGGATCLPGGLLPLSADLVSLLDVVSLFAVLSSRIVIGACSTLLSKQKSQLPVVCFLAHSHTGLKQIYVDNNCSLQIMGGNWLKAHFRSRKTLYIKYTCYTQ